MSFDPKKAIVLMGDGINCEFETAHALKLAGFEAELLHVSYLLEKPDQLDSAAFLVFPGGFSFGDEIESGKVLAIKLMEKVRSELLSFVDSGRLVLGICNGFQALVQMGLLPETTEDGKNSVSLLGNKGGRFINRWIDLSVSGNSKSGFLKDMSRLSLPIRHGEGRLAVAEGKAQVLAQTEKNAMLKYDQDINGSHKQIAALKNQAGNVLGMMPHPEAFVRWTHHPAWTSMKLEKPDIFKQQLPHGLQILKNAREMTEAL